MNLLSWLLLTVFAVLAFMAGRHLWKHRSSGCESCNASRCGFRSLMKGKK